MFVFNSDFQKYYSNSQNESSFFLAEARDDEKWINIFSNNENIADYKALFSSKFADTSNQDYKRFLESVCKVYTLPLLSVNTGTIYTNFAKIFETSDGNKFEYHFLDEQEELDFYNYLQICLPCKDVNKFFSNHLLSLFLYKPNTRFFINFLETKDGRANPILQNVFIDDIVFLKENTDGVEGIIFVATKDDYKYPESYIAVDSEFIYELDRSYNVIKRIEHFFNEAPVFSLPLADKYVTSQIVKKSPIQDSISDILNYNIQKVTFAEDCLRILSPTNFELTTDCDATYHDGTSEYHCESGYFNVVQNDGTLNRIRCQKCESDRKDSYLFGKRKKIRLDHVLEYAQKEVNLMSIIKEGNSVIESDISKLEFTEKKLNTDYQFISDCIMGRGFNPTHSKEAFNSDQIDASFEAKRDQLNALSTKFENLRTLLETKIAKARYGSFIGLNIRYGREYFAQNTSEIIAQIEKLSKLPVSPLMIYGLQKDLLNYRYKENPDAMNLQQSLIYALPLQGLTIDFVIANKDKLVPMGDEESLINYTIKLNEPNLIEKYTAYYHDYIASKKWSAEARNDDTKAFFRKEALKIINKSKIINNGEIETNRVTS